MRCGSVSAIVPRPLTSACALLLRPHTVVSPTQPLKLLTAMKPFVSSSAAVLAAASIVLRRIVRSRSLRSLPTIALLAAGIVALASSSAHAATRYIYATFKGDAAADEKLSIYTSSDAVNYSLFAATGYGGPTGVLRDPSIIKHTDGKYYIAHTVQSWTTTSTYFAIASSTNLVNWTSIQTNIANHNGVVEFDIPASFEPQRFFRAAPAQ